MCGIAGIFNSADSKKRLLKGINAMRQRGKDSFGISDGRKAEYSEDIKGLLKKNIKSRNLIGHNLHSIVGFVKQPIKGKGILAVNGEIYNWIELCEKHSIEAENDSELLLKLLDKSKHCCVEYLSSVLDEINGDYAFAYWISNKVFIARDNIGIKPLWIARNKKSFAFASERKALLSMGFNIDCIRELHPRHILHYDISKNKLTDFYRGFYKISEKRAMDFEDAKSTVKKLLYDAVKRRLPKGRFGILFSGGIDSTLIATIAKKLGAKFTCYTAASSEKSKDIQHAKEAAEMHGFELKYKIVGKEEVETYLKKIVPLIEDSSTVKAAVSLPLFVACEMAKEDGIKVILSGSGSDEVFCGYERHSHGKELAKESFYELLRFFERNSYRDDVITMANNLELRVPYLDKELVEFAIKLKDDFKIKEKEGAMLNKYILRKIAIEEGVAEKFAMRKKAAAQYGSGFDDAIEKLAKEKGMAKPEYLACFLDHKNLRLGALASSGKDSLFAVSIVEQQNYFISCLITIKSMEKDSYMFHTPNVSLVKLQAKAMGKPLVEAETKGEKEKELLDLERAVKKAVEKYNIEGICSGAIHSNYQRERIEMIADKLGIKSFSPLWHIHEESMLNALLRQGFKVMITKTAAAGMEGLAGRIIDKEVVRKLVEIKDKYGISLVGEGGEYESLVLDAPMFKKRIEIVEKEINHKGDVHEVEVKKAKLIIKENDLTKFRTVFLGKKCRIKEEKKIKDAGRELYIMGFAPALHNGFAGNISIRRKKGFAITSTGSNLGKLKGRDIVEVSDVDIAKNIVYVKGAKKPSSETFMHYAIYSKRKDINAIVHGHYAPFLISAKRMGWKETTRFCEEGSFELANETAKALENENFAVIKGHGFVAIGKNLEACMKIIKNKKKELEASEE